MLPVLLILIAGLPLVAALCWVLYAVIRKAVHQGIIDADATRAERENRQSLG